MLLTAINEITNSKEALIENGRVQGFIIELSTVCLYGLYGKLDTLLQLYYFELLVIFSKISLPERQFWQWVSARLIRSLKPDFQKETS